METISRKTNVVPASLRRWFVVHFFADTIFGLPLLLVPEFFLPLFGWSEVDPLTSRLVGAALLGIGVASLLGRNASRETFRAMLDLKIIWAGSAVLGLGIGLSVGAPRMGWAFLAIFAVFLIIWSGYRRKLHKTGA
jgi:hypothetical protein